MKTRSADEMGAYPFSDIKAISFTVVNNDTKESTVIEKVPVKIEEGFHDYSIDDSGYHAQTTSFMVDIMHGRQRFEPQQYKKINNIVHLVMTVIMVATILGFKLWGDGRSLNLYFKMSSYTFGPLLGMFAFGALSVAKGRRRL